MKGLPIIVMEQAILSFDSFSLLKIRLLAQIEHLKSTRARGVFSERAAAVKANLKTNCLFCRIKFDV